MNHQYQSQEYFLKQSYQFPTNQPQLQYPNYSLRHRHQFVSDQFYLKDIDGTLLPIIGNFILEIKTRAFGGAKPLKAVTAARVVQCQWQMCCMPEVTAAILMLYHPEMKTFTLFLIKRNAMFISALKSTCKALYSDTKPKYSHAAGNKFASQLSLIQGNIDFQAILPIRQWAGYIAKETVEVFR